MSDATSEPTAPSESGIDLLEHLTSVALSHLQVWHKAVLVQASRIFDAEANRLDQQTDSYLFVQALRQVLRAADLVAMSLQGDAREDRATAAIEAFNAAVPDAKAARDVLDHFDDYARGIGNLSHPHVRDKKKRVPTSEAAGQFTIFYEKGAPGHYVLYIGNLRIDIGQARDAADALASELLELVYQPSDEDEVAEILAGIATDGPWRVAAAFLFALREEEFTDNLRDFLNHLVTPESLPYWGDFEVARRELRDHMLSSRVIEASEGTAYIAVIPSVGYLAIVREPTLVEAYFVTLQMRPDVGGWRVHGFGPQIPPEELPPIPG